MELCCAELFYSLIPQKRDCSQRVKCVPSPMVENNAFWWSCVDRNYFTIILQSSVGRGEAHIPQVLATQRLSVSR